MDRYFLYCLQQASLALNEERAILLYVAENTDG